MSIDKSHFKEKLKTWVKYEQDIKKLNMKIKELRKLKDELNPEIINYMNKKDKKLLSINSNYQIKYSESDIYQSVNKNYINQKISQYLKNQELGDKVTKFIYDNRDKKSRTSLNIVKKKNNNKF